ncbi:MAG: hypothetical protein IKK00_07420 [Oscillospiraceae bacterium]|nr:hypothetical protein [Oscillospiraceae bacterium]
MIIAGIEHALRFWVDNEEGESICDEIFASFEDLNAFLKEAWCDEKYDGLTGKFSPVEIINGQPDESARFVYDISPIMELEAEEIEDYHCCFEEDYRASKEMAERFGKDTQFVPEDDADDYESKKKHRNEITYICPHCFRELDDCRCSTYPYHLIQIDTLIVPIIRTLNRKGYVTTACCSGHIEEVHCLSIYVAFKDEHDFGNNIPKGAVYARVDRAIRFDSLEKMDRAERQVFREHCIKKLAAWANSLPSLR